MTSYEAKQQIEMCESQIVGAHGALCNAARNVGASAYQAASNKVVIMTLLPLCAVVLAFIMINATGGAGWALLVIVGIVAAFKCHGSAAATRRAVQGQQNVLDSAINNNSNI